jgi:aryl-alcohol dehydrogenase-like predicted oxidoreductase
VKEKCGSLVFQKPPRLPFAARTAVHPIAALQTEYSLWTRDPEDEVLPTTRELGIAFVAYSPLGRGFLTGQIKKFDHLAPDDYRRISPRFQGENFPEEPRSRRACRTNCQGKKVHARPACSRLAAGTKAQRLSPFLATSAANIWKKTWPL